MARVQVRDCLLTYSASNILSARISRRNLWRSPGGSMGRNAPSSFCLMNINPVANSIWCFAMVSFIIFRRRNAPHAIDYVLRSLRPGGLFAFWENNPWNPGTRYVMSRIPFDRDAITLSSPEARHLLRLGGFEILRTDFLFIFPRILDWCRWVEPLCSRLPLGAQYQVLCRKPS